MDKSTPDDIYNILKEKKEGILNQAGLVSKTDMALKRLSSEDHNLVVQLKNDDQFFVLKVFLGTHENNSLKNNEIFYTLARKLNISVPDVICVQRNKVLPVPWILLSWVEGVPLHKLESKEDRYQSAIEAGKALRKIHEVTMEKQSDLEAIPFFEHRIQKFNETGVFSDNIVKRILQESLESEIIRGHKERKLLHGDLTGGNVIVNKDRITFIDPGEIIAGDPMADLAYTQTTRLSEEFRSGVFDGYTQEKALTKEEHERFLRWRLARQCIISCRSKTKQLINDTMSFLTLVEDRA